MNHYESLRLAKNYLEFLNNIGNGQELLRTARKHYELLRIIMNFKESNLQNPNEFLGMQRNPIESKWILRNPHESSGNPKESYGIITNPNDS